MNRRIIEVEKCHPNYCQYCYPDSWNKNINYCGLLKVPGRKIRPVKTFPKCCPLEIIKEEQQE